MATAEGVKDPNEWVTNDEIPECLKKLSKLIIRAFYSIEHSLGKFIIYFLEIREFYDFEIQWKLQVRDPKLRDISRKRSLIGEFTVKKWKKYQIYEKIKL